MRTYRGGRTGRLRQSAQGRSSARGRSRLHTAKGIDLAGKYRQKGDQVTLLIGEGTYRLTKTLEMTAAQLGAQGNQLVVRPMDGASVTFLGGMDVPPDPAGKGTRFGNPGPGRNTRQNLQDRPAQSRRKTDRRPAQRRCRAPLAAAWTEVFIDNEPRRICRWPNDTMELMGKVIDKGSIPATAILRTKAARSNTAATGLQRGKASPNGSPATSHGAMPTIC